MKPDRDEYPFHRLKSATWRLSFLLALTLGAGWCRIALLANLSILLAINI